MKRRDLLKAIGIGGLIPFAKGSDAAPFEVTPPETIEAKQGFPDVYTLGSASSYPALSSGTAMLFRPIPPQFASCADYGAWRFGADGDA